MSEIALDLLTKTEFKNGLAAGIPSSVPIAHKFGEYRTDNDMKQLHECGIVFYPKHPYLLCVMSDGTDFKNLENELASLSRIIFTEVDKQHQNEHLD